MLIDNASTAAKYQPRTLIKFFFLIFTRMQKDYLPLRLSQP